MTIRHIIFDCDGVLIDSEEISMEIDRMLLAENGVHLSEGEMHQRFVGKTFKAMVDEVEAQTGKPLPDDLEARKDVLMLEIYHKQLKPIAGVREVLPRISLPKSIGTNGPRARAMQALEIVGIKAHFGERMTTFEDVKNGKPPPTSISLPRSGPASRRRMCRGRGQRHRRGRGSGGGLRDLRLHRLAGAPERTCAEARGTGCRGSLRRHGEAAGTDRKVRLTTFPLTPASRTLSPEGRGRMCIRLLPQAGEGARRADEGTIHFYPQVFI